MTQAEYNKQFRDDIMALMDDIKELNEIVYAANKLKKTLDNLPQFCESHRVTTDTAKDLCDYLKKIVAEEKILKLDGECLW